MHWWRWRYYGDVLAEPSNPALERRTLDTWSRFWAYVRDVTGCWEFTRLTDSGYGKFTIGGFTFKAHRLSYRWLVGPIPSWLEIDHLCQNRACVRPDHLEAVTHAVNVRRAVGPTLCCVSGHPYDEENTYVDPNGWKRCRACRREGERMRRRAAVAALRSEA